MASSIDPTAEERKKDHIELALAAQTSSELLDKRFFYEPMLQSNTTNLKDLESTFMGKTFGAPLWVSSMTGGTAKAGIINKNLAKLCNEFKLGMGLGSCRRLLYDNEFFNDFDLRKIIGDQPLYANLGIAQVEKLVLEKNLDKIGELLKKLQADGLIIHINPLQEWMQPEGDRYQLPPIQTIESVLYYSPIKIIVKEVGHGMGPKSIKALLNLPIEALEFGAFGGTNFSQIELMRKSNQDAEMMNKYAFVGHDAEEMVDFVNIYSHGAKCNQIILSGGIKHLLDGFYLQQKCQLPSVIGMASAFLNFAQGDYEELKNFAQSQFEGLAIAKKLLSLK